MKWSKCKQRIWRRNGLNFAVEIVQFEINNANTFWRKGKYHWCIYAYLHDGFPETNPHSLPFHGGCTFAEAHDIFVEHIGKSTCRKFGADYQHSGDNEFSYYKTLKEAKQIRKDAEKLFNHLSEIKQ